MGQPVANLTTKNIIGYITLIARKSRKVCIAIFNVANFMRLSLLSAFSNFYFKFMTVGGKMHFKIFRDNR